MRQRRRRRANRMKHSREVVWSPSESSRSGAGPYAEKHSGGPAENRKKKAFGEHLTHQAPAARSQSGANGHLAPAAPRASKMYSTFMQASSKTKAARTRNSRKPRRRNYWRRELDARFFRDRAHGEPFVRGRILARQTRSDYVEEVCASRRLIPGLRRPKARILRRSRFSQNRLADSC